MKATFLAFAIAGLSVAFANDLRAQHQPQITAESILESNITAIGGRKAMEKHTSYCLKASIEVAGRGALGTLEVCGKAPDKLVVVSTIDKVGVISRGFDGKVGWSRDPYQGLRSLEGEELEQLRSGAVFNAELKWRELFDKVVLTGTERVDDRPAHVIKLSRKGGGTLTRYYDTATFLLLRVETVADGPQGSIPVETRYTDYRDLNGVKTAFQWTEKSPLGETTIKIVQVATNEVVDDSRFVKPAEKSGDAGAAKH